MCALSIFQPTYIFLSVFSVVFLEALLHFQQKQSQSKISKTSCTQEPIIKGPHSNPSLSWNGLVDTNKDLGVTAICIYRHKAGHSGCVNQVVNTKSCFIMMAPTTMLMVVLLLLPLARAGVNDTVDQLRNGFTIVPLSDQVHSPYSEFVGTQIIIHSSNPKSWKLVVNVQKSILPKSRSWSDIRTNDRELKSLWQ